ncbi:hypothetical protein BC833DRAFT_620312 [Globomyces pollinis-pini]|nr:hypothetical protein BC833DRAFT_620312 [Globomyces pollinis-pini]KAJ2997192.1 hypothetical protein HDV02_005790 [Globomyces sp. JEL0801]
MSSIGQKRYQDQLDFNDPHKSKRIRTYSGLSPKRPRMDNQLNNFTQTIDKSWNNMEYSNDYTNNQYQSNSIPNNHCTTDTYMDDHPVKRVCQSLTLYTNPTQPEPNVTTVLPILNQYSYEDTDMAVDSFEPKQSVLNEDNETPIMNVDTNLLLHFNGQLPSDPYFPLLKPVQMHHNQNSMELVLWKKP